ncbi:MAG: uracil-DNA glycosylase family protein [Bacteroidota bacterium]
MVTGKAFYAFLTALNPSIRLPKGYAFLNPYKDEEVCALLKKFCDKYYKGARKRVLVLGINPGRLGAGITGIPFTDPVALQEQCGIQNPFEKRAELSSSFVYQFIRKFGGPEHFYNHFLISSVCPLGFVCNDKNANYYDDPKLMKSLSGFMNQSLIAHLEFNIDTRNLIVFGKRNADVLHELPAFRNLQFGKVHVLEHPRFIMQYRRKKVDGYENKFVEVMKKSIA